MVSRDLRRRMVRKFAVGCAILAVLVAAVAASGNGADVASPALAQSNALSWVGHLGGAVQAVAVGYDGLVFVGVGPRLLVYAMCPPSQPVLVGRSAPMPGPVLDIVIEPRGWNADAYVALGDAGLGVMGIADARHPLLRRVVPVSGTVGRLKLAVNVRNERHLFVGAGYGGLRILDADRWTDPREIGVFDKIVQDFVLVGSTAYVVSRNLMVVDVSDPTAPRQVNTLEDWSDAVATDGGFLYVATSVAGDRGTRVGAVHIYDLGVSARRPPRVAALPLGEVAVALAWYPPTSHAPEALMAATPRRLHVIDVGDPGHPRALGSIDIAPTTANIDTLYDHVLLAGGSAGLGVVDVSDPFQPRMVAAPWDLASMGAPGAIAVADGFAYVENEGAASVLTVVDVRRPQRPRPIATLPLASSVAHKAIAAAAGTLYLGTLDGALAVIDVRDPFRPLAGATLPLPKTAWALALRGDRLYVADDDRLAIFDVTDPMAPRALGSLSTSGGATDVAAGEGFVFVTGPTTGVRTGAPSVQVIDVRDPMRPREIGVTGAIGFRHGLALADPLLFVGGLQVVDVTDLAAPREVARLTIDADNQALALAGTTLYAAQKGLDGGGWLRAFDVRDGRAPRDLGGLPTVDRAVGVGAWAGHAVVAAGAAGIWVARSPDTPALPTAAPPDGLRLPTHLFAPIAARGIVGDRICK